MAVKWYGTMDEDSTTSEEIVNRHMRIYIYIYNVFWAEWWLRTGKMVLVV